MTMLTNWDEISETQEYKDDVVVLKKSIGASLGTKFFNTDSPFVWLVSHLSGIRRYFIRHLVDLQDIDETTKLDLLQKDIGFDIPITDAIPLVELLRQSNSWFEHMGNESLLYYIGSIVGSPIEVNYPKNLLFKLSSNRSNLSGAISNSGPLPFKQSKQARIRDGIFWAKYVYQVRALQAQNIENFTDLVNFLNYAHPAGFKLFISFEIGYIADDYENEEDDLLLAEEYDFGYILAANWVTLDNGFKLSAGLGTLSMHGGDYSLSGYYLEESTDYQEDSDIQRLSNDTYTHKYDLDSPWIAFSRYIGNPDGTQTQVFSDTDAIVYENVTTNVGLFNYPISIILTKTYRELKDAAMLNDQKNMRGMWLQELMEPLQS